MWSPIFLHNPFFLNICFFDLQTTFFNGKTNVLQVSGRDTLENAIKITSKTKFSTQSVQIPYHLHPARQGAHPALSNSLQKVWRYHFLVAWSNLFVATCFWYCFLLGCLKFLAFHVVVEIKKYKFDVNSPGWGPYGPLWAHMGPILLKKSLILVKIHKITNSNYKRSKIKRGFAIRTWKVVNSFSKTDDFIKHDKFA